MRLFTALAIPEVIHQQLLGLQSGVVGAHWRPAENFHITLQFFGDVEEQNILTLEQALQEIPVPELNLQICKLGHFGKNQPFALWAGVAGATDKDQQQLFKLASACRSAASKSGLKLQHRKYHPHLTLAYCKNTRSEDVAQYFIANQDYQPLPISSNSFQLYASSLGNGPARYQVLRQFD